MTASVLLDNSGQDREEMAEGGLRLDIKNCNGYFVEVVKRKSKAGLKWRQTLDLLSNSVGPRGSSHWSTHVEQTRRE